MYTLVVVDMQPDFHAANGERVSKNCLREVEEAVNMGAHIIFLEYTYHAPTLPSLMKAVDGYEYHVVKSKGSDDGSAKVQEAVYEKDFMVGRFRVIGVNTDYCVFATTRGLRKRFPNSFVEVVEDACDAYECHDSGLKMIRRIAHVDVI